MNILIEKTIRMNFLYDFYQSLLTDKQNQYMALYYLDDWSLGEIANQFNVSRQAVFDNIKRTEALLEEYERKLKLQQRFQERKVLLARLNSSIKEGESPNTMIEIVHALEKLE